MKTEKFTPEEIAAAKSVRDEIIKGESELKCIYMAGEIVMWDEINRQPTQSITLPTDFEDKVRIKADELLSGDDFDKELHKELHESVIKDYLLMAKYAISLLSQSTDKTDKLSKDELTWLEKYRSGQLPVVLADNSGAINEGLLTNEEILRSIFPAPKSEAENNDDINILKAMQLARENERLKQVGEGLLTEALVAVKEKIAGTTLRSRFHNGKCLERMINEALSKTESVVSDEETLIRIIEHCSNYDSDEELTIFNKKQLKRFIDLLLSKGTNN